MTTVEANGVTLTVEHFGEARRPLILLAGGATMLSWPDALCEALARGGRHVVRYDLRDSGASTTVDPEAPVRATAERIWDRTATTEPAVHMANQMAMAFSKLDCQPRWRERLPELAIPTLVTHGRRNPFFPVGNGDALAREIPGARLLVLERAATAIPDAVAGEVAAAMIELDLRQLS
jgi:pimeloyl-ACP methyl ester carboxylesterase